MPFIRNDVILHRIYNRMVYRIADNITSPLGMTSAQNYQAVKAGHSALACYSDLWDIPTPFTAALLSSSQTQA